MEVGSAKHGYLPLGLPIDDICHQQKNEREK
jgi:hypothetical protein